MKQFVFLTKIRNEWQPDDVFEEGYRFKKVSIKNILLREKTNHQENLQKVILVYKNAVQTYIYVAKSLL